LILSKFCYFEIEFGIPISIDLYGYPKTLILVLKNLAKHSIGTQELETIISFHERELD